MMQVPNLPRQSPVTLEFHDLSYSVQVGNLWNPFSRNKGQKTILKNVTGVFKPGQLTAIMGPSGSGKTTLMNILAGYKNPNSHGSVLVNGRPRDLSRFRKITSYIMQEDAHIPQLTILEAMRYAAQLKLPRKMSRARRELVVSEILENIGLSNCQDTRTCKISNGQRKRLSMALELINNPPLMLFDEPLSGLDSSTCFSCVTMLKALAQGGRTIIATVHQPSARIFERFDCLYFLAQGQNLYRGPTQSLAAFLEAQGLPCPPTHNPAVFAIELASGDYGEQWIDLLASVTASSPPSLSSMSVRYHPTDHSSACDEAVIIANDHSSMSVASFSGALLNADADTDAIDLNSQGVNADINVEDPDKIREVKLLPIQSPPPPPLLGSTSSGHPCHQVEETSPLSDVDGDDDDDDNWCLREVSHFVILFKRTFVCVSRDMTLTHHRLVSSIFLGFLIGALFHNVGNDASKCFSNAGSLFIGLFLMLMSSMLATVVTFPMERKTLIRENLNCWYSLKASFLARTTADLPFQFLFPLLYVLITYYMTEQPREEAFRFWIVYLMATLCSLVGQSIGLLLGSVMSVQRAVFVAPVTTVPLMLFAGFLFNLKSLTIYLRWVSWLSFTRYGFRSALTAVYGFNRTTLNCPNFYCEYKNPQKFLEVMDADEVDIWEQAAYLIAAILILRFFAYWGLRFKIVTLKYWGG